MDIITLNYTDIYERFDRFSSISYLAIYLFIFFFTKMYYVFKTNFSQEDYRNVYKYASHVRKKQPFVLFYENKSK